MAQQQHITFWAHKETFLVGSDYRFFKELGRGAHGCVVAVKHNHTGKDCAVKKISSFDTKVWPFGELLSYPLYMFWDFR